MNDSPLLRMAYVALAALAGAITAIGAARWQEMSAGEIFLTLVIGFSFAIFVTPWLASAFFHINETDTRAIAGMTYVFAAGWNAILPRIIRRFLGDEEAKP